MGCEAPIASEHYLYITTNAQAVPSQYGEGISSSMEI